MAAPDQPRIDPAPVPADFRRALGEMEAARFRPELYVEQMPAPQRIAPYASALTGDVTVEGEDAGSGRLVVLHDPAGNEAWDGTFRCVAYVRGELDPEQAGDPMLAGVAWTWLTEALASHDADYAVPSGSITCVTTENFGGMDGEPGVAHVEIRASWSPLGTLTSHVQAWGELMCTAAGLSPVPEGVATFPNRRGQRGRG